MQVVFLAEGEGLSGNRRSWLSLTGRGSIAYEEAPSWRQGLLLNQALPGSIARSLSSVGGATPSSMATRKT